MSLFFVIIILLYIISYKDSNLYTLKKEKTDSLKGIMAIIIVIHHLAIQTGKMHIFTSWGAPIVSFFFFISGYGLTQSIKLSRDTYLRTFFKKRIIESLLLPFLLCLIIYRVINYQSTPNILEATMLLFKEGYTTLPHSWYVYAIIYIYLIFLGANMLSPKHATPIITILIITYIIIAIRLDYSRCWYITTLAFPAGLIYATYEKKILTQWDSPIKYYSTVPICLVTICTLYITKSIYAYMLIYTILPPMLACIFSKVPVEKLNNPLINISKLSYEIYLSQGVATSLFRGEHMFIISDTLYITLSLITTIIIAYGLKMVTFFCKSKLLRPI